jgi:predicted dehydrogenase
VEIVVNLTIPAAHAEVSTQILEAGKHVWSEKPLTTDRDSAQALLVLAEEKGLRVGGAPDTVLGAGIQSGLRALADGTVGEPRFATALMRSPGPESWHPNPAFLFQKGAGPLLDIGPYYLTSLVLAQGPVARVSAVGTRAVPERVIGSGPKAGETFEVEVFTQISALLQHENGATSSVQFTFDTGAGYPHVLDLNGSEGTLRLPDPNTFDGPTEVGVRTGDQEWTTLEATGPVAGRGLGTLEMARAIRAGVPHRLSGALAAHVLDVMLSIQDAATTEQPLAVASSVAPVPPLPADFDPEASTLQETA